MPLPRELTDCEQYRKVLAVKRVRLWIEFWAQRHTTLHGTSAQKKCLQKGMKVMKSEARSGEIENVRNHVIAHPTKEEIKSIKSMAS